MQTTQHGGEDASLRPLALTGAARTAPAALREHLPGLEPERQISDWGRSEVIEGVLDRFVYDFLFHYWFRVEVEGDHSVPAGRPGAAGRQSRRRCCPPTRR